METNQKELKWLTNVPNVCGYLPEEDKLEPCAERGAKHWINSLRARGHRVEVQYAYINGKLDKYMFSVWSDFSAESIK